MRRVADPAASAAVPPSRAASDACSTVEVARRLGLAVRSVQLMVDRGELQAWKTPGGHRRICRASVDRWLVAQGREPEASDAHRGGGRRVLLIEDSRHDRNLVTLVLQRHFPQVELHDAGDGFLGLTLMGSLQPHALLIDLLLPGIDGATLVSGLRAHRRFAGCSLVVITALEGSALDPYRAALDGVPVVHKSRLVGELPGVLERALGTNSRVGAAR